MEALFTYLLEANICILIFYVPYWLLFKNMTHFQPNRFYLLGALLFSVVVPLINIQTVSPSTLPSASIFIDELVFNVDEDINPGSSSFFNIKSVIALVYFLGAGAMAVLFIIRLLSLAILVRSNPHSKSEGLRIVLLNKNSVSFSFFRTIFISPKANSEIEKETIIRHEKIHIGQMHSIDNLFSETLLIVMWFNPLFWFIRKEIRVQHEYYADNETITSKMQVNKYKSLLLKNVLSANYQALLTSSFNSLLIKKRLVMMTRQKSAQKAKIRYLIALPLFLTAIIVFSCESEKNEQIGNKTLTNSEEQFKREPASQSFPDEPIFLITNKMPSFKNSDLTAFRKFVQENLSYPKEAKVKGIEGRVFVQFVVSSEGNVKDVKVDRGIDPLLDAEAVRVIQSSPKWTPGALRDKPVAISFTIPVVFNL